MPQLFQQHRPPSLIGAATFIDLFTNTDLSCSNLSQARAPVRASAKQSVFDHPELRACGSVLDLRDELFGRLQEYANKHPGRVGSAGETRAQS